MRDLFDRIHENKGPLGNGHPKQKDILYFQNWKDRFQIE